MCRTQLSNITQRFKELQSTDSTADKRRLKKVFKNLSFRCATQSNSIDKESFLRYTELPGLFGERFFDALNISGGDMLNQQEFTEGILALYRGNTQQLAQLLFRILDYGNLDVLTFENFKYLLSYLPPACSRCKGVTEVNLNFPQCIDDIMRSRERINLSEFEQELDCQFIEVMIRCLINSLPVIIDELLEPKYVCPHSQQSRVKIVNYQNFQYYCQIKNQGLYYSKSSDMKHLKGIILLKGLFPESIDNNILQLRNLGLRYIFEFESSDDRDEIMAFICREINYRKFHEHYIVGSDIGSGAEGIVEVVRDKITGQQYAAKIVQKKPLDNRQEARLRREINILRVVNQENLLQLVDLLEDADTLYIVTEYIPGGTLFDQLYERKFQIEENEAKHYVKGIAAGLNSLHNIGVIHRDMKLENILLRPNANGFPTPVIIDYGLSCILGPGAFNAEPVGTLKYTAPEVIQRTPYRELIDVWSLGVISYILIVGRMPFFGKHNQEIAARILRCHIDYNSEKWAGRTEEAKDIVRSLLQTRPDRRMTLDELLSHEWIDPIKDGVTLAIPSTPVMVNPFKS